VPTVSIFTTVFASLATSEAQVLGLRDFKLATMPHPLETMSQGEVSAAVRQIVDDVSGALICGKGVAAKDLQSGKESFKEKETGHG
jgi:hypothetical protein